MKAMLVLGSLAFALAFGGDGPDTVELESGKVFDGRVVYQDDETVVLRSGTRDREFDRDEVVKVSSIAQRQRDLFEEAARLDGRNVRENGIFAREASRAGLERDARFFWWRVLAVDPDNAEAHAGLGHKQRRKSWLVSVGGRSLTFDKALERARDFGGAWEIETLHYTLRTNLELYAAVELAFDLENLYASFFDLLARELRLFEQTEPMQVHVHADAASYPESGGEAGYYAPDEGILRIDASSGLRQRLWVHEATHQLLDFTAVRERAYSGAIPGWLGEGLAEYIGWSARGVPGSLVLEPGWLAKERFTVHAEADRPYDLSRVLGFNEGDFRASSKRDLKYAQAYTLVHFCLHGDEGAHRDGFLEYLRGVYRGQGSSTDFKKALGVRGGDFEEAWTAYVKTSG